MKYRIIAIVAAIVLAAGSLHAQMKKPTIMVVPSDNWCIQNGYYTPFEDMGRVKKVPDYRKALQENYEIRSLVASLGNMMASFDYPLRNLEAELKKIENDAAEMSVLMSKQTGAMVAESPTDLIRRTAKCDIIIDIAFRKIQNGPDNQVIFNITAIDAYSSEEVAACPPVITDVVPAPIEKLLETAVTDVKETFRKKIEKYFDVTSSQGRNARILLKRFDDCLYDFESDVEYIGREVELGEVIKLWFYDNCVGKRFNLENQTENTMDFHPASIPVRGTNISGAQVPIDASDFIRPLAKMLKKQYGIECKVYPKGLGEAWLILGGK